VWEEGREAGAGNREKMERKVGDAFKGINEKVGEGQREGNGELRPRREG
jgi:hypothetical protein